MVHSIISMITAVTQILRGQYLNNYMTYFNAHCFMFPIKKLIFFLIYPLGS